MNTLLSQDAAEALLFPHRQPLADCLREAVDRFHADRAVTGPASPRTRASQIYDYIEEAAERAFSGVSGVRICREHGFLVLVIEDTVVIRFKKLTDRLATCGIPTRQARRWAAQEPLDGMPEVTNLVAGYVLDDLGEIARLVLVCAQYGRVRWAIDLHDGVDKSVATIPFPLNDGPEPERVMIRSAREKDGEDDGRR